MAKKTKTRKNYTYLEWIGFLLIDISLILAFTIQYKHYYEILVVGFFLVLYELDKQYLFMPQYIRLYSILFKAGIIGDLVLGIGLGLWHYNFAHLYEYVLLYAVGYPIAGLVMVQSYVFASKVLKTTKKHRKPLPMRFYRQCLVVFGVGSLIAAACMVKHVNYGVSTLVFYGAVSLLALTLLSYISRLRGCDTIFEEIHNQPLRLLLTLFVIIYFYAFLHEISNSVAHQWVYTVPLTHLKLLNIPLIVFAFWPLLVLIPVGAYYYVIPSKLVARTPKIKTKKPQRGLLSYLPAHAQIR